VGIWTGLANVQLSEVKRHVLWCLPDSPKPVSPEPVSPKPDSLKLGLGVGVFPIRRNPIRRN